MKMYFKLSVLIIILIQSIWCNAQRNDGIDYPLIGKVQPRNSNEIAASNWSIGGETMDRDFTNFDHWKQYLGPTGAKKVRLQAGWAKCEPKKGVYNFEWLDNIIDEVIAQGVEPWLQTSYGNPIYEGGGYPDLSGGFPVSEEALIAWDKWVKELVKRYQGKVNIWEIWNESDLNAANTPEAYADIFIRTAEIIRARIPDANIYALSLARTGSIEYVKPFLHRLKEEDKLNLVDQITLHGYTFRPEDVYNDYVKIQRLITSYSAEIIIGQGELGAPSENQKLYALNNYPWTEISQSKWLLRKMLGDLGRDIPSLYFGIIDMNYIRRLKNKDGETVEMEKPIYTVNTKGLIKAKKDNSVDYLKPSYYSYQNITSVFDHSLERIPNYPYSSNANNSLSVFGYQMKNFDYQVITIWDDSDTPNNSTEKTQFDFEFSKGNFIDPVYVDMRTGEVYDIPKADWQKKGTFYKFKNIPVYDSPILIAEKSVIRIIENNK